MSKAFSLLEVLIAMAIITIGLVAALNLIAASLHSYKTSSQQIIDANKAQACAEEARNKRDRGEISGSPYVVNCEYGKVKIIYYLYDWQTK